MFKPKNKLDGIPKILVGKYRGTPIDQLPNSYLRWMITQDFPEDWLRIARKKLEASPYSNINLNVTRHAIDQFSLRFLEKWQVSNTALRMAGQKEVGLGTYMALEAELAWKDGEDVSKKRHDRDGIVKEFDGIKWVFNLNPKYPEYKDVITVMPASVDWEMEDDYCGGCGRPLEACTCPPELSTLTNV